MILQAGILKHAADEISRGQRPKNLYCKIDLIVQQLVDAEALARESKPENDEVEDITATLLGSFEGETPKSAKVIRRFMLLAPTTDIKVLRDRCAQPMYLFPLLLR